LPRLAANFPVPVLIVQHMPPLFTQSLATSLDSKCAVAVCEAQDGESLQAGTVYIAPGGRQMKVGAGMGARTILQITDDPPENNCRPSVDYLFRSVANHYTGRVAAVIMTGMGSDGVIGLRLLKRKGSHIIAQDEASCVVFGMPGEAVKAGIVDVITPLDRIAEEIRLAVKGGGR
jgi:two-component system chemotaxis response regulator CheB